MGKLLLLSCCGPCSCAVIENLNETGRDFAVLFYNPNIFPRKEYEKRKRENKKLCQKLGVMFVDLDYEHYTWLSFIKGLETEPERGQRCKKCFFMRLKKAAQFAKQNEFESFTSVLGVSRYKNMDDVNAAGLEAAALFNIQYDTTNWRKGGLEDRRRILIKEQNIYDQNYCGCEFSKKRN
jgi:predicted adenine nucleotide alpha hydrolase (AANH) superfamily ATPase